MRAWQIARWFALVVAALVLTVGLARLFSGPEDTWIRDASGKWVAHGRPAGGPPPAGYRVPVSERVLPWLFIVLFAAALVAAPFVSARSPAGREAISRSLRFWGMASVLSAVLGAALLAALGVTLWGEHWRLARGGLAATQADVGLGSVLDQPAPVLLGLLGLAAVLLLLGAIAYGTKKVLEAHFDLKRQIAMVQDTMERLSAAQR